MRRKRYTKKRKFGRKRRRTFGKKVMRVVRRFEETKWISTSTGGTFGTGTPFIALLNGLNTGTIRSARNGNRINMISIALGLNIQSSVANVLSTRVRVMVVVDRQANATTIVPGDVFAAGVAANLFLELYDPNTVPTRYRVLKDKMLTLNPVMVGTTTAGATVAAASAVKYFRFKIGLKALPVKYNDQNNGDIRDIIGNALYLLMFTDQASTIPACAVQTELKWKDD